MHGRIDQLSRHLVFVSALWVALVMVLLCAVLPAGLPLTKTVGSAFSPSTTVVALRETAQQVRGAAKRIVKGDPEPATDLTLTPHHQVFVTLSVPTAAPPRMGQRGNPSVPHGYTPPLSDAITRQPYPRGPPIA